MLGWNPGTEQELFSLEELIRVFSLDRVIKSGARFNMDKAKWFNQEYLRQRTDAQLAEEFLPFLKENGAEGFSMEYICHVVSLIKERAQFVSEFWGLSNYFFAAPTAYDPAAVKKFWKEETAAAVGAIARLLSAAESFDKESVEHLLHNYITENSLPMGKVMNSIRLAIVGESKGPGVADIIATIGQSETVARLDAALDRISL